MKTIETMAAWFGARRQQAEEKKKAATARSLMASARRAVQVREFSGEVYVCLEGIPVLPIDALKWDVGTALDVAREAYVKFRMEECGHGH